MTKQLNLWWAGYGFIENEDYCKVSVKIYTSHGREHAANDYEDYREVCTKIHTSYGAEHWK